MKNKLIYDFIKKLNRHIKKYEYKQLLKLIFFKRQQIRNLKIVWEVWLIMGSI